MATAPTANLGTDTKSAHTAKDITGSFKVDRLRIYTPARGPGSFIEMNEGGKASWTEINFYEDIYSPVVHGDITIQEGVGLVEATPIMGEEILEVRISTAGAVPTPIGGTATDIPPNPDEADKFINHFFRIYKLDPPVQLNENFRAIKMHFVSDVMFTNMQVKVQRTYPTKQVENQAQSETVTDYKPYTVADIVRDIYVECLIGDRRPTRCLPTNIDLLVEPTRGASSVCIPNWTPFKAINFLASRAMSVNSKSKGSNFVFYETLKGFRFVSIETLFQGGLIKGYKKKKPADARFAYYKNNSNEATTKQQRKAYIPVYDEVFQELINVPGQQPYVAVYTYKPANIGGRDTIAEKFAVTEFSLVSSFDTMKNLGMGMYANKVVTHDLIQMKQTPVSYYYIEPPEKYSPFEYRKDTQAEEIRTDTTADNLNDSQTETKKDEAFHSDPGKLCSYYADMIGSADTHISLYPTNKDVTLRFATGISTSTVTKEDGTKAAGADLKAETVHGKQSVKLTEERERKVEEWLAQRISQRLQSQSLKINFTVPGDSSREVGDLIWFQYPSENPETAETSGVKEPHKYYSGKYLVTALKHKIVKDQEYIMAVEAMKDGYRSQIAEGFGLSNPMMQEPDGTWGLNKSNDKRNVHKIRTPRAILAVKG